MKSKKIMVRLLIAEDHALMREGLKQLFELFPEIKVMGKATNGGQVMELLSRNSFDLVLLDMSMPGVSSIDLIAWIHEHFTLPILVLSMHNEPQLAMRAFQAGANGYLT